MRAHPLALACLLAACGEAAEDPPPETKPFPVPAQAWSIGDPSREAQELLAMVNRMRADPAAEVDFLLAAPRVTKLMQTYGMAEEQLRADFAGYAPSPPLAFDSRLIAAAAAHAADLAAHPPAPDANPHQGSDGTFVGQRAIAQGYRFVTIAENVFLFASELAYDHAAFAVDWGNDPPGHRYALLDLGGDLSTQRRRDVGLALVPIQGENYGPFALVEVFGAEQASPSVFLTGAAFTDGNGDGFYQAGEGVSGIDVVPDQGDFHAITSASGGYAIPFVPGEGPLKLQLQKAGKVVAEARATIEDANVALDFVLQP